MRALIMAVLSAALLCVMAAEMETADAQFPRSARSGSGELLSDARCPGGLLSLESPRGDLVCLRKESAKMLVLRGFEPASKHTLDELYKRPLPRIADTAQGIAAESNKFGVDLYKVLARDGGNVFFSPIAVYLAFSALYEGAGGETREQMRRVFGFDMDAKDRRAAVGDLLLRLEKHNPYVDMNIRSAMLIDDKFRVSEDYVDLAHMYATHVETADTDSPDLPHRIDRWAGHATKGSISEIVDADIIAGTASMLVNPVYFDAEWQGWFPRDGSSQRWSGETNRDGSDPAEYMVELCTCFYNKRILDGPVVSWLQYRDSGLSMLVASTTKWGMADPGSLEAVDESLTADVVLEWPSKANFAWDLTLVLMQFRSIYDSDLRDPLRELGLTDVFDARLADLGGISDGLYMDGIVQKGAMETSWEGGLHPSKGHINHNENRFQGFPPLLFIIVDDATGTILFMGRVADQTTIFEPVFLQ